MPIPSLTYLSELKENYEEIEVEKKEDSFDFEEKELEEYVEAESKYREYAQELSELKVLLPELLKIVKNEELSDEIRENAIYVGFLSNDEKLWRALIKFNETTALNIDFTYSLLPKERQYQLIEISIELAKEEKIKDILDDIAYNNGYLDIDFSKYYLTEEGKIDESLSVYIAPAYINLFFPNQFKTYFVNRFLKMSDDENKTDEAERLLDINSEEAFKFLKLAMIERLEYFSAGHFIGLYGSPSDLIYFEKILSIEWENISFLKKLMITVSLLGSLKAFNFYYKLLDHDDGYIRVKAHRYMSQMFNNYNEDDEPIEGTLSYKAEELFKGNIPWDYYLEERGGYVPSSQLLREFWEEHQEEVKDELDLNYRYTSFGNNGFKKVDLLYELKELKYFLIDDPHLIDGYINNLMIRVGRHFAYDPDTYFERRLEQYNTILQWLEDNKDRFKKGRWYRFGNDVTNEKVTFGEERELPKEISSNEEDEILNRTIITLKSREIAPKTGRYQPTLPKGHPDEEFVKESRFIKRVEKGQSIGTFGLTGGNEELIVWVYLWE